MDVIMLLEEAAIVYMETALGTEPRQRAAWEERGKTKEAAMVYIWKQHSAQSLAKGQHGKNEGEPRKLQWYIYGNSTRHRASPKGSMGRTRENQGRCISTTSKNGQTCRSTISTKQPRTETGSDG